MCSASELHHQAQPPTSYTTYDQFGQTVSRQQSGTQYNIENSDERGQGSYETYYELGVGSKPTSSAHALTTVDTTLPSNVSAHSRKSRV